MAYFCIVGIALKDFVAPRLAASLIEKYEISDFSVFQVELSIVSLGAALALAIFLSGLWAVRAIN